VAGRWEPSHRARNLSGSVCFLCDDFPSKPRTIVVSRRRVEGNGIRITDNRCQCRAEGPEAMEPSV